MNHQHNTDDITNETIHPRRYYREGFVIGALLAVVIIGIASHRIISSSQDIRALDEMALEDDRIELMNTPDLFSDLNLGARAVYVWDMRDERVLFAQNEHAQLPLASLSKIMTAYVARTIDIFPDYIDIDATDLSTEGDNGLFAYEQWQFDDLVDFTLVTSSNDGSRALASSVSSIAAQEDLTYTEFTQLMNDTARTLGMANTYFLNPSGLDIDEEFLSGSYGSAHDVTVLVDHILRTQPDILEATRYDTLNIASLSGFVHKVKNTNQYVGQIAGILASKTGYTTLAGGNLMVAYDVGVGHPIIVTVLGSSRDGRFEDVEKLIAASRKYVLRDVLTSSYE